MKRHEQQDSGALAKNQAQEDRRMVFEENGGYLFSDFWPFLITHFGEKGEKKSPMDILKTSLSTLTDSFQAQKRGGYHQGKEAYRAWINGLSREEDFRLENDRENVQRRLSVNDAMLGNLIDARRAAVNWLQQNLSLIPGTAKEQLAKIAQNCQTIADGAAALRRKACRFSGCEITYNTTDASGMSTLTLRREQTALLEQALALEEENCQLAGLVLKACG